MAAFLLNLKTKPRLSGLVSFLIMFAPVFTLHAAEGAHHEGMPTKPLMYAGINFLLLVILLAYLLRKPMKDFFASRALLTTQRIREAQELKAKVEAQHAKLAAQLKNLDPELDKIVHEMRHDGEREQKRVLEVAQAQANALQKTMELMVAQETSKAKTALKSEAIVLAAQMAEAILRKQIGPEDQRRLALRSIEQMEQSL